LSGNCASPNSCDASYMTWHNISCIVMRLKLTLYFLDLGVKTGEPTPRYRGGKGGNSRRRR